MADIYSNSSYADFFWSVSLFEYTVVEVTIVSTLRYAIWLCGIIGNITLLTTIARNKVFHASGYMLMANLAVGEIYISSMDVASHSISLYWYNNPAERLDIYALHLESIVAVYGYNITVFTMLVVSCNRFCSVIYYNKYKEMFSTNNTIIVIIAIYVANLLMVVPFFPSLNIALYIYHPRLFFHFLDTYHAPGGEIVFLFYQVFATLAVLVMITFYICIIRKLQKIRKVRSHQNAGVADGGSHIQSEDVLLCIQFSIVTLVFIVTWVVLAVYIWLSGSITSARVNKWVMSCVILMFQTNYAINPYVYMIVNKRMRMYMRATVTFHDASTITAA